VAMDRGDSIGRDLMNEVGRDQGLKIGKDSQTMIGNDATTLVGKDNTLTVGKDNTVTVGKDNTLTVGKDFATRVGRDVDILVGKDLTKQVARNERETTGQNRSITVGQRRTSEIGTVDSTSVGVKHFVKVSPPKGHKNVTSSTMTHEKIVLTTGAGATITMEGAEVRIDADAIKLAAKKFITAEAESEEISILAKTELGLRSQQNIVVETVDGHIDIMAKGGDLLLTTEQTLTMISEHLSSNSHETALINASKTVTITGPDHVTLTSKLMSIEGSDKVVMTGNWITIRGDQTFAMKSKGTMYIWGSPVNINP
jgi:uncharacterized protein (DUF2345 family)